MAADPISRLQFEYGLQRRPAQVLATLSDGEIHSRESLLTGLFGPGHEHSNAAAQYCMLVRTAVAGTGSALECMPKAGYRLRNAEIVRAVMAGEGQ